MIHPQFWSLHSLWHRIFYNQERDAVTYCKYLDVKDKVVLDLGAGDFGTAKEFLKHGARKVICVEKDFYPVPSSLMGRVEAYNECFKPEKHLRIPHDVEKFDIEGYEIELIPYFPMLKRAIAEVHSEYLVDTFLDHKWRILRRTDVVGEHCIQVLMVNDHE